MFFLSLRRHAAAEMGPLRATTTKCGCRGERSLILTTECRRDGDGKLIEVRVDRDLSGPGSGVASRFGASRHDTGHDVPSSGYFDLIDFTGLHRGHQSREIRLGLVHVDSHQDRLANLANPVN